MIPLVFSGRPSEDKRLQAGYAAEKQLAFYLDRAFGEEAFIHVFHGLRVERHGDVAQIDHLVLHRFGFVLVESKSISGKVTIDEHGDFTKSFGSKIEGIPSPVKQARRQAELLVKLLNDHKTKLRGMVGIGPIKRQGEFVEQRFNVIAAISDKSVIECQGERPDEVKKADAVVDAIRKRIADHQALTGFSGFVNFMTAEFKDKKKARENDKNNLYAFTDEEFEAISNFLLASNKPGRQSTNLQPASGERVKARESARTPPAPAAPSAAPKAARPPSRQTSTVPRIEPASEADTGRKSPPANNMKRWSDDELARLRLAFAAGKRPEDIAADFGRTPYALRKRAETIGLIVDVSKW